MKSGITLALALGATIAAGILAATGILHSPGPASPGPLALAPPEPAVVAQAPGPSTPGHSVAVSPSAVSATPARCRLETRYLLNPDGTTTSVYSCPNEARARRHAYEDYSTQALESLAYADARAAEVLGMRLRHSDETRALSLTLRAAALAGGDPAPILAFSNAYPRPSAIDGVPVRRTVHTKFVLSAVAELLGAERNNLPYWEARIRQVSSDPDREIGLLMEQARRIIAEMREIELELAGSSSFGGQSDA